MIFIENDTQNFAEAFPAPETDQNHNTVGKKKSHKFLMKKTSNTSLYADVNEEVVKAATYMKLLLRVSTFYKNQSMATSL